jgi:hypothetical protein
MSAERAFSRKKKSRQTKKNFPIFFSSSFDSILRIAAVNRKEAFSGKEEVIRGRFNGRRFTSVKNTAAGTCKEQVLVPFCQTFNIQFFSKMKNSG